MRGYFPPPDPNQDVWHKWVGKRVNRNGTNDNGTVTRAYWGGLGKPTSLTVDWDVQTLATSALTDSEHVTLIKEV